ncbi:MAG: dTDP-4-dehydrorhamnose 3,5-epimerase family protein [Burkholderiaceae bacterium]
MKFHPLPIHDAWLIEPTPHLDDRGRFMRTWCHREFADAGVRFAPTQMNMAFSRLAGTLRGLHYQVAPALEAKLVRCTRGAVFDVVVDLRADSPTRLKWHGERLSADNGCMLLVPEGCAHGALSLEDETEILYMTSAFYSPAHARGVRHDDPAFRIDWPVPVTVLSDQDRRWPLWGSA